MKKITLLMVFLFIEVSSREKNESIIYVLQWLSSDGDKLIEDIEYEHKAFYDRKCKFVNCYVSTSKSLLEITDFDVILFNVVNLRQPTTLPSSRVRRQKYIFYAKDPAASNTISNKFNAFFNFTWTYKLDSEISMPYIIVTNKRGDVVGPKTNMNWLNINSMKSIKKKIRIKLNNKKIAVAWIMSNCRLNNRRIKYVERLQERLHLHLMKVDIYGCEYLKCPKNDNKNSCYALLDDYYFYLAFENFFCEDYVTEKILHAVDHYAVPIVYGGANYTSFLPEGSYLNARDFEPTTLADEIAAIIFDKNRLYEFFKWHRYYKFKAAFKHKYSDGVCDFCAMINNKESSSVQYQSNLSSWWNGPLINVIDPEDDALNKNENAGDSVVETTEGEATENSDFIEVIESIFF